MKTYLPRQAALCSFLLFFLLSCSSPGPLVPEQASPDTPGITPQAEVPEASSPHMLWAYYLVYMNPAEGEYEVIPTRLISGHWNVLKWLEQGPCTSCVKLKAVIPNGDTILVDLEIRHPFDNPQFTGFDVRGIAMFSGTHLFPETGLTTSDRTQGEGELVNADGYTTLYNPSTAGCGPGGLQGYLKGKLATPTAPSSTLNGYKRHVSPGAANTRNAFYAGTSILQTYEIDMPDGPFVFGYAVDASWAPPTVKPVTNPMTQFPPEANCPEPWKIDISIENSGQGLTDKGGFATLTISVFDRQGKGSHKAPVVECPELFDGQVTATWLYDTPDFAVYTADVHNNKLAPVGQYKCLVSVEDNENDSAPDWLDLTAYQVYTLKVYYFADLAPVAVATASDEEKEICQPIHFSGVDSYDPDGGNILCYEWDWNNDGFYEEAAAEVDHTFDVPGVYEIPMRVTDDEGTTAVLSPPLEITATNALPTAIGEASKYAVHPGESITFNAGASHDNDCSDSSIVQWEWDFENDGAFDDTGVSVSHAYTTDGKYNVMLRVTDDEGAVDLLDIPLHIQVSTEYFDPIAKAKATPDATVSCTPILFEDDGSYDPDGGLVMKYEWDWENDGFYDAQGPAVFHTWTIGGEYEIGFRVTDNEGVSTVLNPPLTVLIGNGIPLAVLNVDKYIAFVNEPVSFAANSSHDTDCGGDEIVGYAWDFDEDGVDDDFNAAATHSWPGKGHKQVRLTVTDDDGLTAQSYAVIDVNNGWARTWGGADTDHVNSVAVDSSGNAYVLGTYWVDADFDPGPNVEYRQSTSYSADVFLSKFDSNGNFIWVKTWGSIASDFGTAVACGESGSVYLAGIFEYVIDLDPNYSVQEGVSNGSRDVFVVKLDAAGNYVFGFTVGGPGNEYVMDLEFSSAGDYFYYCGSFEQTVDFNPYSGTDNRTSVGMGDVFLCKHKPTGAYEWTRAWGGPQNDESGGLAIDIYSNPCVAGFFRSTVDFNAGAGVDNRTSAGVEDAFLTKYYADGTYGWTAAWGGTNSDVAIGATGGSMFNETWVAGYFMGTCDFDPTAGVDNITSNGQTDIFLSGFNPNGSRFMTKTWGGSNYDEPYFVHYNPDSDHVAVSGYYRDTVDFDPSSGYLPRTSNGGMDCFVSHLTYNGLLNWVNTWGGAGHDVANAVAARGGILYAGGHFSGTVYFDPQENNDPHTASASPDAFLSRYPVEDGVW